MAKKKDEAEQLRLQKHKWRLEHSVRETKAKRPKVWSGVGAKYHTGKEATPSSTVRKPTTKRRKKPFN